MASLFYLFIILMKKKIKQWLITQSVVLSAILIVFILNRFVKLEKLFPLTCRRDIEFFSILSNSSPGNFRVFSH